MAKTKKTSTDLEDLRELVAEDGEAALSKPRTRRGLLKMAGAALAGAAGAAALKAVPAAASDGNAVLQGSYNYPSGSTVTAITPLAPGGAPLTLAGTAFLAAAPSAIFGQGSYGTTPASEIGVFGTSKSTNSPGTGVLGTALHGTGTGVGVQGASGAGVAGLFTSNTGYDVQAGYPVNRGIVGSGRISQAGRFDANSAAPNWAPLFFVSSTGSYSFAHELVRGSQATIWASRYDASSANQARWKRINTVRVDTSDGTGGIFKPFRVIDTRSGAKKGANTMTVVPVANLGSGASHIPADAIAVMGNLAAVNYSGPGFLAIMPAGIVKGTAPGDYNPAVDPSSVNFIVGQAAIANSFICGLSGGAVQVWVGGAASHFVIDVTAYLQ